MGKEKTINHIRVDAGSCTALHKIANVREKRRQLRDVFNPTRYQCACIQFGHSQNAKRNVGMFVCLFSCIACVSATRAKNKQVGRFVD